MAKKPNYNDPEYVKYLERMKVALVGAESGGQNVKNPLPNVTATGFYQYNAENLDNIKAHAKTLGYVVNDMEDFRKNEALQHSFFRKDQWRNYQFAKKNLNNKLGLNIEQLGYLAHWQGETGAGRVLTNNKLPDPTYTTDKKTGKKVMTNPDGKIVMGRFTKQLKDNGLYEETTYQKNILRSMSEGGTPLEEKKKIQKKYEDEVKRINGLDELPIQKNQMIQTLNKKFFDEGNLEIVNQKTDYRNNNGIKRLQDLRLKRATSNIRVDKNGKTFTSNSLVGEEFKEWQKLEEKYKKAQSELLAKNPNANVAQVQEYFESKGNVPRIDIKQYISKDETTEEEQQYDEDGNPIDGNSDANLADASGANYNEQYQYDGSKTEAEAIEQGLTDNEFISRLRGMDSDPKFKYIEGNAKIPIEAGLGLLAGISGMNAANEKPNMRDEEIDEALLQYASMQQKIAKMGLAPEAEAALKNDLASMHQTGMNNIVKASNGNRNLVLGNQGQLDQARMEGLSKIALMDLDARQKGMDAYGRVAEYMSNFKATKNIANNERQYAEFQKRQAAGVAVAEKGFATLIDSLKTARETGPGSAYDMYMQKMKFSITGVNERIPDDGTGKPMTQSAADIRQAEVTSKKENNKKIEEYFYNDVPEEKRADFKKMWQNNPTLKSNELIAKFNGNEPETSIKDVAQAKPEMPTLSELNNISLNDEQLNDGKYNLENPMPEKGTFAPPGPKRVLNTTTDETPDPDLNALQKSNDLQRTQMDKEIQAYGTNLASVSGVTTNAQIPNEVEQNNLKAQELNKQAEENLKRIELASQAILAKDQEQGAAIDAVTANAKI